MELGTRGTLGQSKELGDRREVSLILPVSPRGLRFAKSSRKGGAHPEILNAPSFSPKPGERAPEPLRLTTSLIRRAGRLRWNLVANLAKVGAECIFLNQQYSLIFKGLAAFLNNRSMQRCAAEPGKHSVRSFKVGVRVK